MCTVTKKKEMLFLMYASILQKYYMDNLPSVMQHKKKKKKKAPNLPLLFSYYSLVLSFPQGESES